MGNTKKLPVLSCVLLLTTALLVPGCIKKEDLLGEEQERNKEFEHRVIAINKARESEPSNTVMAVL